MGSLHRLPYAQKKTFPAPQFPRKFEIAGGRVRELSGGSEGGRGVRVLNQGAPFALYSVVKVKFFASRKFCVVCPPPPHAQAPHLFFAMPSSLSPAAAWSINTPLFFAFRRTMCSAQVALPCPCPTLRPHAAHVQREETYTILHQGKSLCGRTWTASSPQASSTTGGEACAVSGGPPPPRHPHSSSWG